MGQKRIPLDLIYPNPDQPRKIFDPKKLAELAASIRENGLAQPIAVRPDGEGKYMIIMGERRWRAHCILAERKQLETPSILANVRKLDDEKLMINAIIENMQRDDITPLEEANAFQRALDEIGCTVEEMAKRLGIQQPRRIRERLQLLKLEPTISKLFAGGHINPSIAYEISRLEPRDQLSMIRRVSQGLVNITAVRAAVDAILDNLSQEDILGDVPAASDADVATLNRMERKIEQVQQLLAQGWKDGDCIAATKVSPDRTTLMADKISHMIRSLRTMENSLREKSIQVEIVMQQNATA